MLKKLIKDHIANTLKGVGFSKKGLTWNRNIDGYIHVINIQPSHLDNDSKTDFTVNIGILLPDIWETFWDKQVPKFVKEENCYPRFRLGELLAGFNGKCRDKWWTLSVEKDVDVVGKELETIINDTCLPFFDKAKSISDICIISDSLNSQLPIDKLYHSILLHFNHDDLDAKAILSDLLTDPHWRKKASSISGKLFHKK